MNRKGFSIYRKGARGAWYVSWTDGTGRRRVSRASDDKRIAAEIGRRKVAEADRVRGGVVDAQESHARDAANLNITAHIDAWEKSLKSKGRTASYIKQQRSRVAAIFEAAGVQCLADLKREKVQDVLGRIAEDGTPQTANHYRTAVRMFSRWCFKTDRTIADRLFGVELVAAHGETFSRTPFNADALARLLAAAEARTNKRHVLPSTDRAMYYRIMAYTGFRLSEAASLTPESFNLGNPATVTVQAGYSKRRRRDEQLIPQDVAAVIRPWLKDRPAGERLFPITKWTLRKTFLADCKAAGIEAAAGERLGLHSLRRFYITSVVRGGGLAVAQQLARHSTPKLTAKYTDLELHDLERGIAGLPAVEGKKAERKRIG